MKKILYIDTSGKYSTILFFNESVVFAQKNTVELNTHAQSINLHMQEIFEETNTLWSEIAAIAVMNGPGSYTGLRIGLSSAKGFCYAHNIPLILVTHFQLLHAGQKNNITCGYVIRARENEYFFQAYDADGNELGNATLLGAEEIGLLKVQNHLTLFTPDENLLQLIDDVSLIRIAPPTIQQFILDQFSQNNFANLMVCEPFYLKNVHINKINKL